MIAVDTNVIVRLLTRDDHQQAADATSLFAANQIWIAKTVILEVNWVLKSIHRYRSETVREAIESLIGLPNVRVEDEFAVVNALALTAKGIDFADALHLERRLQGARFVSFDQAFIRLAQRAGVTDALILDSKTSS